MNESQILRAMAHLKLKMRACADKNSTFYGFLMTDHNELAEQLVVARQARRMRREEIAQLHARQRRSFFSFF